MPALHQIQRSRRLRVIGLLAWFALVLQSFAAMAQPPTSPAMKAGDHIPVAASTDLMAIISEKGGKAGEIFDIISEVHQITKSLSAEGRLDTVMSNLAVATKDFREAADNSKKLLAQIRPEDMKNMSQAMTHMDSCSRIHRRCRVRCRYRNVRLSNTGQRPNSRAVCELMCRTSMHDFVTDQGIDSQPREQGMVAKSQRNPVAVRDQVRTHHLRRSGLSRHPAKCQ